eukprot:755131-Hanusia_phi.AAC.2
MIGARLGEEGAVLHLVETLCYLQVERRRQRPQGLHLVRPLPALLQLQHAVYALSMQTQPLLLLPLPLLVPLLLSFERKGMHRNVQRPQAPHLGGQGLEREDGEGELGGTDRHHSLGQLVHDVERGGGGNNFFPPAPEAPLALLSQNVLSGAGKADDAGGA